MSSLKSRLQVTLAIFIGSQLFAQDIIHLGQTPRGGGSETVTAVNNGYIITFIPGTSKTTRALAALQAGAQLRYNYDNLDAITVTASSNAVNALRGHPAVVLVSQDSIHHGRVKPGSGAGALSFDSRQLISYEVQRVGIPENGSDGTGIGIALLDSGIDFAHPDLAPAPNSAATACL